MIQDFQSTMDVRTVSVINDKWSGLMNGLVNAMKRRFWDSIQAFVSVDTEQDKLYVRSVAYLSAGLVFPPLLILAGFYAYKAGKSGDRS